MHPACSRSCCQTELLRWRVPGAPGTSAQQGQTSLSPFLCLTLRLHPAQGLYSSAGPSPGTGLGDPHSVRCPVPGARVMPLQSWCRHQQLVPGASTGGAQAILATYALSKIVVGWLVGFFVPVKPFPEVGSCPETPLRRPVLEIRPPPSALEAVGGSSIRLPAASAGRAATLHPALGLAGQSRSLLPPCTSTRLPQLPAHAASLPGSGGLLPRVAAVPWGSPAPATQQGGGNARAQPEHYKQNDPRCHKAWPCSRWSPCQGTPLAGPP